MTRNDLLYVVLRVASWLQPLVPLRLAYALAAVAGEVAYRSLPAPRRAIEANLAVVLQAAPEAPRVRETARQAFRNDALNWVDTLRIGRLNRQQVRDMVDIHGWENLERALQEGKGAILVTVHLGNFDLVGQIFPVHGVPLTMPVEHMQPEKLFDLLARERASLGLRVVPVENAAREMLRALKAGQVVGVAGDRAVAGRTSPVQFFGRPALLPTSAVSLAERTGAPLLLTIGLRGPHNHYSGIISPPLPMTYARRAEAENLGALARAMEEAIRRHPEQWLAFSPVWKDYPVAGVPATIEQPANVRV